MTGTQDVVSTFSYDGEADPDSFSLSQLRVALGCHFGTACNLYKLAEGGYHKVYEVLQEDGASVGVVRVAAPAFPKDKLESEVATLKYLAAQTRIPVPKVYAWNSDSSNSVGAEYMIIQKLPGISANILWDSLSINMKERVVAQVAEHLKAMFALRFDRAGSLYLSSPPTNEVHVGPIVSTPFYRALDGVIRIPDTEVTHPGLSQYRGPFSNTSDYLQSFLRAELHVLCNHSSIVMSELDDTGGAAKDGLRVGERAIRKALQLCTIYPGNNRLDGPKSVPEKPFSLRLDDFRLSNIMIDEESGDVTGLIDFEGTTIAPIWECALLPRWLQDPDDPEASYEGGPADERRRLREVFWENMGDGEWRRLYECGKPFRLFTDRLSFQIAVWASKDMEEWVDKRLIWAKAHPGLGFPENNV